jgi:hypothetical protein
MPAEDTHDSDAHAGLIVRFLDSRGVPMKSYSVRRFAQKVRRMRDSSNDRVRF